MAALGIVSCTSRSCCDFRGQQETSELERHINPTESMRAVSSCNLTTIGADRGEVKAEVLDLVHCP